MPPESEKLVTVQIRRAAASRVTLTFAAAPGTSSLSERLLGCGTRIHHPLEIYCFQPVEEILQRPSSNGTARTS